MVHIIPHYKIEMVDCKDLLNNEVIIDIEIIIKEILLISMVDIYNKVEGKKDFLIVKDFIKEIVCDFNFEKSNKREEIIKELSKSYLKGKRKFIIKNLKKS